MGDRTFGELNANINRLVRALRARGVSEGDSVAMAGELKVSTYTDKDGAAKPSLDLIAHAVLTEYHVARKRKAMAEPAESVAPDRAHAAGG